MPASSAAQGGPRTTYRARVRTFLPSAPHTHTHPPPDARSLGDNNLGAEGGKAIAAVLPQTKITDLKCAPPSHTPQPGGQGPADARPRPCAASHVL